MKMTEKKGRARPLRPGDASLPVNLKLKGAQLREVRNAYRFRLVTAPGLGSLLRRVRLRVPDANRVGHPHRPTERIMKMTANCPSWLPGRWVKSKTGKAHAYVIVTKDRDRATSEEVLLRLHFLADDVTGPAIWTVSKLQAAGSRFLKNKPRLSTCR